VLFCLYLGLYHALFGTLLAVFRTHFGRQAALLLSPFAWVAVELARARITGLPWDLLGIAQVDNSVLIRLAPVYRSLWALLCHRRSQRSLAHPHPCQGTPVHPCCAHRRGVVIVVLYVAALRRIQNPRDVPATVHATLVQENLEVGAANTGPQASTQQLLESFSYLSRYPSAQFLLGIPELPGTQAVYLIRQHPAVEGADPKAPVASSTNLIVWPESPAPFQENDPQFRSALASLAREANAPIIAGNIGIDRTSENARGYNLFNSASFITRQGDFAGRYDKMHLVPFGEYVPFKQLFFFAKSLLNEVGTFDPGQHRAVFTTGGHSYGTFICYESIFGDEVRQFTQRGAEVLINISNDGWYGDTSAPWQHLNMARMRAIENHRWVLRATNTGVTASISPFGRVIAAAPRHIRTSIRVSFAYEHDLTFYAAHGDLFAYACALITAIALGFSLRAKLP